MSDQSTQPEAVQVAQPASPPLSVPHSAPNAAPRSASPPRRDRIVVLGRTQSGKTIFLASLYCRLWKQPEDIAIRAVDGRTHKACVEIYETLKEGRWPSSTIGSRYLDFEVTRNRITRPLVSLDYPGEVFRKAFIDNTPSPDVEELLEHIDRAAGVIALLDPAVVVEKDMRVSMDDDFGMLKALERIRSWPGGENVPVAIALTKYDLRAPLLKANGGPAAFVKKHYKALTAANRDARVFVCSAVQQREGESGTEIDPEFRATGVIAPLRYILQMLTQNEQEEQEAVEQEASRARLIRAVQEHKRAQHRNIHLWTWGTVAFIILMALLGWGAWVAATL